MKQIKNPKNDEIHNFIINNLKTKFNYEFTNVNYRENACDVYRSESCRFMIYRSHNPIDGNPSIVIVDAACGGRSYDSSMPETDNTIFQGYIDSVDTLKSLFNIFKIS